MSEADTASYCTLDKIWQVRAQPPVQHSKAKGVWWNGLGQVTLAI